MPIQEERRMFQAHKWEPDLAKSLGLPPGTRLQRRSAWYRIPELKFPLVRVDQVYRMAGTKSGATGPVAASIKQSAPAGAAAPIGSGAAASEPLAPPSSSTQAAGPAAPLSQPEGELLWDNAMIADHVMVQAQLGVTRAQLQTALPSPCRILSAVNEQKGLYLVGIPADSDDSLERAVLALNHESLKKTIWFAEPDFLMGGADTTPDDPYFTTSTTDTTKQWGLARIMAPRAWDVIKQPSTATIANSTVVAVVDTGVDYTHPDVIPNLYVNPGESGGGRETNGIDDDANGKIDDYHGWNFVENNNDPMDDVGHGTHVAGIVGAAGNNTTGGSGVCWGVKMLPVRIIKNVGGGTYGVYSDAVAAMDYLRALNSPTKRIAVANHSWGGSGYSLAMLNAVNNPLLSADPLPDGVRSSYSIDTNTIGVTGTSTELNKIKVGMEFGGIGIPAGTLITIISGSTLTLSNYTQEAVSNQPVCFANPVKPKPYGIVHVAAAGNSRFNADRIPTYPASLPSGFMMSVGATDTDDAPAIWTAGAGSNYGRLNVDIFAPGSSIVSTRLKQPGDPDYGYESRNGTSMAAPFVSGAIALLKMWQPKLTDLQSRQIVIDNADAVTALSSKCMSGGRLNIAKVVDKLYQPMLVSSGGSTGGSGTTVDVLDGALALTGRLAVGTTGYSSHSLALVGDRVWSWGSNGWGELGDDTLEIDAERSVPEEIAGLSEVRMIAASDNFSMALKGDGTVWVWGSNYEGLFGNGTTDNHFHPTPVQVAGLEDITWISAASLERPYCLAVREDGKVFAWGNNQLGQLGDGTTIDRLTPQMIPGLGDIVQADAGPDHALAVTSAGQVYAWGSRFGQGGWTIFATGYTYGNFGWNSIGDGPETGSLPDSRSPVLVPNLTGIVQVEATLEYSLAVDRDGVVWEWGHVQNLDTNTGSHGPVVKQGVTNIVALATGAYHSFAEDADGRLYAWGLGSFGALGNARDDDLVTPQAVVMSESDPIISVAGGPFQSMAVTADGKLVAWGLNHRGQIGMGRSAGKNYPNKVRLADTLTNVVTDGIRQFGLSASRRLYVWGFIGDITLSGFKIYETPKLLDAPVGIVSMDTGMAWDDNDGNGFMFAVSDDNSLYVLNTFEPPGSNPNTLGYANMVVWDYIPPFTFRQVGIRAVATTHTYRDPNSGPWENNWHALFITTDGRVKGWGGNAYGQLGNNSNSNSWTPLVANATAASLSSVTQVAAGVAHSLALKTDGTVWAWGRNNRGQLGNGTQNDRNNPGQVPGLTGIEKIIAGDYFSVAIKADGTTYAWGGKFGVTFPELSSADQLSPVLITSTGLLDIVAPGDSTMLCQRKDGKVLAWTANEPSTILAREPGSTIPYSDPAEVVGLSNIKTLSQDYNQAFAVKPDGTLYAWGGGTGADVLGDGDSWSNLPIFVVGFGGSSATQSTLGTSSSGDSWLLENFSATSLVDVAVTGDIADPDGDGIANLLEYALGLDPNVRDASGLPTPRLDAMTAQSASESAGSGQVQLFSVDSCCIGTPVGLDAGKHYMAFTVERRGGIRTDIDYLIEVSNDLVTWRSGTPDILVVINTGELLEAYSTTAIEDQPHQFMRLKIRRK